MLAEQKMPSNLIFDVIGKDVYVDVDSGCVVFGRLVGYQKSNPESHVPSLLILQLENGDKLICRWRRIFWSQAGGMKRQVKR